MKNQHGKTICIKTKTYVQAKALAEINRVYISEVIEALVTQAYENGRIPYIPFSRKRDGGTLYTAF